MARRKRGRRRSEEPWLEEEITDDDAKYTDEEWLVPARDEQGQSTRLYFRLTPIMSKAIDLVVHSRIFPFRTPSEFLRHAVMRELALCHRLEPDIPQHYLGALQALSELLGEEQVRVDSERIFQGLMARVESYLSLGDVGEATRLAALAKAKLAMLPDSAWKRRFMGRHKRQFSNLLQPRGRPRLLSAPTTNPSEDDEDYGDD